MNDELRITWPELSLKTHENFSQCSRSWRRDLNPGPPKFESGLPPTTLRDPASQKRAQNLVKIIITERQ